MMSKGSVDSIDKSIISSDTSLGCYEPQAIQHKSNGHKSKLNQFDSDSSPEKKSPQYVQKAKMPPSPHYDPYHGFELAYRNEGFRDNSTFPTRNNSYGTSMNDDTPIVHQIEPEDSGSDYYGNSSTLPIRARGDNLSFLTELKQHLPEYEQLNSGHSSFLASTTNPPYDQSPTSVHSFGSNKRIGDKKLSLPSKDSQSEIRRTNEYAQPTKFPEIDGRRPDSYYTAMRNARDSKTVKPMTTPPPLIPSSRPKTVYESSAYDRPVNIRSKSEALLEANFDDAADVLEPQLTSDSRSYSQPMETAM